MDLTLLTVLLCSFMKFRQMCVFAEWAEGRIWDTWLSLVSGRRHSRSLWMWTPCSSASSGHSKKSSNLFSSVTPCCLALCSLPDGPLISWWESKRKLTDWRTSLFSHLELIKEVDQADILGICGLCSSYKLLMSPYTAWVFMQFSPRLFHTVH